MNWADAWDSQVSYLDGEYIAAETAEESRVLAARLRKAMRRASEASARRHVLRRLKSGVKKAGAALGCNERPENTSDDGSNSAPPEPRGKSTAQDQ